MEMLMFYITLRKLTYFVTKLHIATVFYKFNIINMNVNAAIINKKQCTCL